MSKKVNSELIQVSVPTKKINFEVTAEETVEIILRPFKQRDFAVAIAIINKYFDQFNSVRDSYINQRRAILDRYEDEVTRKIALKELDAGFDEGMEIARAIFAVGEGVAEDIKTIVAMSIYKATSITAVDEAKERSPIDPELDDLTWGECLVLLGATVGLNLDFFNQNSTAMNLIGVFSQNEPKPKQKPKAGVKSSPASSKQDTAIVK